MTISVVLNSDTRRLEISLPFSRDNVDRCRSIPGARWLKNGSVWTYPATPAVATSLCKTFGNGLAVAEPAITTLLRFGEHAREIAGTPVIDLPCPDTRSRLQPWDHQVRGYNMIRRQAGTLLAWDMGTGKTKAVVDAVSGTSDIRRVLIACPCSVVGVWSQEVPKHARNIAVLSLRDGSVADRACEAEIFFCDLRPEEKGMVVINYEALWREPFSDWAAEQLFDLVVADESHRIGDHTTRVGRFMCRRLAPQSRRRVCLTGTPMGSGVESIFGQFLFLDPGIFGTSVTRFRSEYCYMGGFQNKCVLGPKNIEDLNEKIYSVSHMIKKRDVLDLPPVVHEERVVNLCPSARKVYDRLEEELIAQVDGGVITAANAITKLVRLQQITSGYAVVEEPHGYEKDEDGVPVIDWDQNIVEVDKSKRTALVEIMRDLPTDDSVVVFARFIRDLSAIRSVAKEGGRGAFELSGGHHELDEWKEGTNGDVLGVQIQAGGVGVDLSRACYCVYYSLDFSLTNYDQSLARLDRHGQTRPVTYIHILSRNTVDSQIRRTLDRKRTDSDRVMKPPSMKDIVFDVIRHRKEHDDE